MASILGIKKISSLNRIKLLDVTTNLKEKWGKGTYYIKPQRCNQHNLIGQELGFFNKPTVWEQQKDSNQ